VSGASVERFVGPRYFVRASLLRRSAMPAASKISPTAVRIVRPKPVNGRVCPFTLAIAPRTLPVARPVDRFATACVPSTPPPWEWDAAGVFPAGVTEPDT
jgi:hypothetical protein